MREETGVSTSGIGPHCIVDKTLEDISKPCPIHVGELVFCVTEVSGTVPQKELNRI